MMRMKGKGPDVVHIVPAQPGLRVVGEDAGKLFISSFVIAWRCATADFGDGDFLTDVEPITVDGCESAWGILHPDGMVAQIHGAEFSSMHFANEEAAKEWDEAMRKRAAIEARRAAKAVDDIT